MITDNIYLNGLLEDFGVKNNVTTKYYQTTLILEFELDECGLISNKELSVNAIEIFYLNISIDTDIKYKYICLLRKIYNACNTTTIFTFRDNILIVEVENITVLDFFINFITDIHQYRIDYNFIIKDDCISIIPINKLCNYYNIEQYVIYNPVYDNLFFIFQDINFNRNIKELVNNFFKLYAHINKIQYDIIFTNDKYFDYRLKKLLEFIYNSEYINCYNKKIYMNKTLIFKDGYCMLKIKKNMINEFINELNLFIEDTAYLCKRHFFYDSNMFRLENDRVFDQLCELF